MLAQQPFSREGMPRPHRQATPKPQCGAPMPGLMQTLPGLGAGPPVGGSPWGPVGGGALPPAVFGTQLEHVQQAGREQAHGQVGCSSRAQSSEPQGRTLASAPLLGVQRAFTWQPRGLPPRSHHCPNQHWILTCPGRWPERVPGPQMHALGTVIETGWAWRATSPGLATAWGCPPW